MFTTTRHMLNGSDQRLFDHQEHANLLARFLRWRRRRQGIEAMRNLPDYLLRDIGLTRLDLHQDLCKTLEVVYPEVKSMRFR